MIYGLVGIKLSEPVDWYQVIILIVGLVVAVLAILSVILDGKKVTFKEILVFLKN